MTEVLRNTKDAIADLFMLIACGLHNLRVRYRKRRLKLGHEPLFRIKSIEDAAIATVAAVEQGNPGMYLIANDHPVAVREWLPAFAHWLHAPPPPQISVEDALKASGADAVYYGTQMRGVSNAKAKRELKFQPRPLEWIVDTAVAHAS